MGPIFFGGADQTLQMVKFWRDFLEKNKYAASCFGAVKVGHLHPKKKDMNHLEDGSSQDGRFRIVRNVSYTPFISQF